MDVMLRLCELFLGMLDVVFRLRPRPGADGGLGMWVLGVMVLGLVLPWDEEEEKAPDFVGFLTGGGD